jgi:glycosyltransferase involved in cell wall biosynthesis
MKLQVIVIAYRRAIPLRSLIDSFLRQTNPDWQMTIIHDGPAPDDVKKVIASYNDPRITFTDTEEETGNHGFFIRGAVLPLLPDNGFVLNTNDDNQYVPRFVEFMLKEASEGIGIVFCDTVHSHQEYNLQVSELKVSGIDMGAFIVRLDIAKEAGFTHNTYAYDGYFAEDCLKVCVNKGLRAFHIRKPLYIHN